MQTGEIKMSETSQALNMIANLPSNTLIQFPAGSWGFVGRVDVRLGWARKDGSMPTDDEINKAKNHGPGMIGLKIKSWLTKELDIAAAKELGLTVTFPKSSKEDK